MAKATHVQKVRCGCGEEFDFDVVPDGPHFEAVRKGDTKCPACGATAGHSSLSIEEA